MSSTKDFNIQECELTYYTSGGMLHPDGNYPEWAIREGPMLVKYSGKDINVEIPDGVLEVGEEAFFKNKFVEEVTVPESTYAIGINAFCGCTNLKRILFKGTIHFWGDYIITKKQNVELVFLKNSIDSVVSVYQEKALVGFLYAGENGVPVEDTVRGENLEGIKRRRKKLYPVAFENPVLLGLILDNKLIPRKELDDVISQATELGHTAVVAQLLSYSQQK